MLYTSIGKKAIHLKRRLPGTWRTGARASIERFLPASSQDVLSVEDVDCRRCYGPGVRWGVMGPNLQWHLAAASVGSTHFRDIYGSTGLA